MQEKVYKGRILYILSVFVNLFKGIQQISKASDNYVQPCTQYTYTRTIVQWMNEWKNERIRNLYSAN